MFVGPSQIGGNGNCSKSPFLYTKVRHPILGTIILPDDPTYVS